MRTPKSKQNRTSLPGEITFTVTVSGAVARSMEAIAFVSGRPIEIAAADTLSASDNRCESIGDLLEDALALLDPEDDVAAMVERLKKYRDSNGITYPDYLIENGIACFNGQIDADDEWLLNAAAEIIA